MKIQGLLASLNLPASSLVQKRVPKKLLLENGAPTPADKRHINDGIEELFWVAVLKPTTTGIPEYRDNVREYLEIAVLQSKLRAGAKADRLMELVHRAVPYPVVLMTDHDRKVSISAAHKRWSQSEADRIVLEEEVVLAEWESGFENTFIDEFSYALSFERQPHSNVFRLYEGWLNTMISFNAAALTGQFTIYADSGKATARRDALRECSRLEIEILRLRTIAKKEKQIARQIELNMELKRVKAAHASALSKL
ncbi:MAG: DUF4391 domain-containing protein [Chloroflexi bacterium]|nr:DUF4391 domain-containing protein [Chloroflexota bacterium]